MTKTERDLMTHALGGKRNYRNGFVADNGGQDATVWHGLCAMGYAMSEPFRGAPNSTVFFVTDAGRAAVGLPAPQETRS